MTTNYPEKTCDITRLLMHPKLVEAALNGTKTQQRRNGVYAYPDETFELQGVAFVVTFVESQRLGDMTDADAQAEGYPSYEAYKQSIIKMHGGMEWHEDASVWVHTFRRIG